MNIYIDLKYIGDEQTGEIINCAIVDDDANTLFNRYFSTINVVVTDIDAISPEMLSNCSPFSNYALEINEIIEKAELIFCYGANLSILRRYGVSIMLYNVINLQAIFSNYIGEIGPTGIREQALSDCMKFLGLKYIGNDSLNNALAAAKISDAFYAFKQSMENLSEEEVDNIIYERIKSL